MPLYCATGVTTAWNGPPSLEIFISSRCIWTTRTTTYAVTHLILFITTRHHPLRLCLFPSAVNSSAHNLSVIVCLFLARTLNPFAFLESALRLNSSAIRSRIGFLRARRKGNDFYRSLGESEHKLGILIGNSIFLDPGHQMWIIACDEIGWFSPCPHALTLILSHRSMISAFLFMTVGQVCTLIPCFAVYLAFDAPS